MCFCCSGLFRVIFLWDRKKHKHMCLCCSGLFQVAPGVSFGQKDRNELVFLVAGCSGPFFYAVETVSSVFYIFQIVPSCSVLMFVMFGSF